MSRTILLSLLVIWILAGCQKDEIPKKLQRSETVNRLVRNNLDYSKAKFISKDGSPLTEEERKKLNSGQMTREYYVNSNDEIIEVRVVPINGIHDKIYESQLRSLLTLDIEKYLINISCENINQRLLKTKELYDNTRKGLGDKKQVYQQNQELVFSLLENCPQMNLDSLSKESLETIWYTIEKGDLKFMMYYYDFFYEAVKKGFFSSANFALFQDRILMMNGFPQYFGSQISDRSLYRLEDPDNVNKRRDSVGLSTIQAHLSAWKLDFEEEIANMKIDY